MKKDSKRTLLIIILSVLIVVCIGVTVWAVFFRGGNDTPLTPDYPPQGTEQNQQPIEGDSGDKIESPEGGGAISVTFGTNVTASLSGGTVTVYYANPNASNQDVAILIMVDDLVVAKSELINPGNQVNELKLEEYAKSKLQVGGYDAELVVRAYDPVSGEKAMVDTKGELTLTVTP